MRPGKVTHMKRRLFILALAALSFAACGSSSAAPAGNELPLDQLPWCGSHPVIAFTDEAVVPNTVITDWATAQKRITFTLLLPATLPGGSCLLAVGGVVGDPIFQSRFSITYALPGAASLSIAETPAGAAIPQPICSASKDAALSSATCQLTTSNVNVTISGKQQTSASLQAILKELRSGITWKPHTSS